MLIRKTVLCSKKTAQTGALKRKELGEQLQGIDYIYTVNGQLKSINHPSLDETLDPGQDGSTGSFNAAFGKDVFGLTLDYHTDDYLRHNSNILSSASGGTNLYNGLISAQRYKTRAVTNSVNNGADKIDPASLNITLITGTTDEIMNRYSYDEEYHLSTSVFGVFNNSTAVFTANANNYFKEYGASANSGIGYDANGNITSLKRNGYIAGGNLAMDDFTYTYISNTNKLTSIVDAASSTYGIDLVAATSKTFTSNSIGQMLTSEAEDVTDITYYATGLTKKVSFGSSRSAEYWYDDRGQKIKTKFYNASSLKAKYTWYMSDAGGNPLAIYEYDEAVAGSPVFVLASQPVYGSGRIGVLDNTTGIIDYEVTDHLGNVRATIKGISAGVYQLTTRTDYYAFGGVQPGRTYNLNTYRFSYQGQESSVNSRWQAFDLRMHNSDLGRWFAPDPEGQFHSPYVSMGNNPVSGVDPDGGYVSGGNTYANWGTHTTGRYWGNMDGYTYIDGQWWTSLKDALDYRSQKGDRYRAALKELEKEYGGASGLYNDAGYDELFKLQAAYGMNASAPHISRNNMSSFAHGGSIAALEMMGQNTSHSYEAQESDKIQTLASLGGYQSKGGRTFETNGNGQMGYYEDVQVAALAYYKGGDENHLHQAGIAAQYKIFHPTGGAQGGGGGLTQAGYAPNEHWIGPALIGAGLDIVPKSSVIAKAIFPASRVVLGASKTTSIASLTLRRLSRSVGLSFVGGTAAKFVPVVGWGWTIFDATMWGLQNGDYNDFKSNTEFNNPGLIVGPKY